MSDHPIEDLRLGDAFRESVMPRADGRLFNCNPFWHGWVIMDAYLAGLGEGRRQEREACAKVALEWADPSSPEAIAEDIRKRGQANA